MILLILSVFLLAMPQSEEDSSQTIEVTLERPLREVDDSRAQLDWSAKDKANNRGFLESLFQKLLGKKSATQESLTKSSQNEIESIKAIESVKKVDASSAPDLSSATKNETISLLESETENLSSTDDEPAQGTSVRELPVATIGVRYCQTLSAASGEGPFSYGPGGGRQPGGLVVNYERPSICGTPTSGGIFSFSISTTDRNRTRTMVSFRIVVRPANSEIEDEESSSGVATLALNQGVGVRRAISLQIENEFLQPATVGTSYFDSLRAVGGFQPYRWVVDDLPAGLEFDGNTGVLGGTPEEEGESHILVTVIDSRDERAEVAFSLSVRSSPLFLATGRFSPAIVGESFTEQLVAQGGSLPYSWSVVGGEIPAGFELDPQSGVFFGLADKAFRTTARFEVRDSEGARDSADIVIEILDAALEITTPSLPPASVGLSYSTWVDARGGTPPYTWNIEVPQPFEATLAGQIFGVADTVSEVEVRVSLTDTLGASTSRNFALRVDSEELFISTSSVTFNKCEESLIPISVSGGIPPYRYQILSGAPSGISISGDGVLSGQINEKVEGNISLSVSDTEGNRVEALLPFSTASTLTRINTPALLPLGNLLEEYQLALNTSGGCGDLAWEVVRGNLPEGLILGRDGLLTGVLEASGEFEFEIDLFEDGEKVDSRAFSIAVEAQELEILTQTLPGVKTFEAFEEFVLAQGGVTPYSWEIVSGELPPGLILISAAGSIVGEVEEPGSYNFSLRVTDRFFTEEQVSLSIEVEPAPLRVATTSEDLAIGQSGVAYSAKLRAEGGTPPYQWFVSSGELPAGLALDGDSILGTPTEAIISVQTFTVLDSLSASAEAAVSLEVLPGELSILTSSPLQDIEQGVLYEFQLEATGGLPPYTWNLSSGNLPDGIFLEGSTGKISGVAESFLEESIVTVNLSDSSASTIVETFSVYMNQSEIAPVRTLRASPSDSKVGLYWRNPNSETFRETILLRNTLRFPLDINDGEVVYRGSDSSTLDSNLVNGESYYYSVIADHGELGFAPIPGDGTAQAQPQAVSVSEQTSPFADIVEDFNPLDLANSFGSEGLPGVVLGAPFGGGEFSGSLDVVSLHSIENNDNGRSGRYGGSITLKFSDNIVVNGPGPDFTIFENPFRLEGTTLHWIEPGIVEVSTDGTNFYRFPFDFVPHFDANGNLNLQNPFSYLEGFAGVQPVFSNNLVPNPTNSILAGGDRFDLSSITEVDLPWIQYVRITAIGDKWLSDKNGEIVRHAQITGSLSGTGNSGFDLDAVVANNF